MSKSILSVVSDVRNGLLADPEIKQAVGENVFPLFAPKGTTGDFVTVFRQHYKSKKTKFGIFEEDVQMSIIAFSTNYDRSLSILEEIRKAIMEMNHPGGYGFEITDSTEDIVDYDDNGGTCYAQYMQVLISTNFKNY